MIEEFEEAALIAQNLRSGPSAYQIFRAAELLDLLRGFISGQDETIEGLKLDLVKKLRRGIPVTDAEHAMMGFQPRPKMDAEQMWSANCACGYKTIPGTPHDAFKSLVNHVKDKGVPA